MELEILRETPDLIIVNKPSGLLTLQARGDMADERHLLAMLRKKYGEMFVVHRLDKDASGLIMFARNAEAHRYYSQQFETREIDKKYLVAVHGKMPESRGEIEKPLKQRGSGRMSVAFDGKPSLTKYRVLRPLKGGTLLEVSIVTGRRHQIRAHLYSLGHPVIGDSLYGDSLLQGKYPRLMLHSWRLRFKTPEGRSMTVEADPPKDFMSTLNILER